MLDQIAQELTALAPGSILPKWGFSSDGDATFTVRDSPKLSEVLAIAKRSWGHAYSQMISLQEELDWECYKLYGIIEEELT